jgi:hypothetical protein
MSCGCNNNSSECPDVPYPQISRESVPSLIDNLVYALYGTINKSVTNGRVVWDIPCDPTTAPAEVTGIPREEGEGLLCYIIRVLNEDVAVIPNVMTTNANQTVTGIKTFTQNIIGNLTGDIFASNGTTKVLENGTGANATFTGDVTGNITGNVTGNVTGNLTGNVTGNLTGDVFASNGTTKILENGTGANATFTGSVTGNLTGNVTGVVNGTYFSYRNKIINGIFRINQRNYVSGTNSSSANQYTLDRWRIVASGQNIIINAVGVNNIVTAPNGGIEQIIESLNIEGGTYILSWQGTASATINGTNVINGGTISLPANTNAIIKFQNGTVSLPQLEAGTIATPFEWRNIGTELALCQRYYWQGLPCDSLIFASYVIGAVASWLMPFPVEMRADNPEIASFTTGITLSNCNAPSFTVPTKTGLRITCTSTAITTGASFTFADSNYIAASSEL